LLSSPRCWRPGVAVAEAAAGTGPHIVYECDLAGCACGTSYSALVGLGVSPGREDWRKAGTPVAETRIDEQAFAGRARGDAAHALSLRVCVTFGRLSLFIREVRLRKTAGASIVF
jgi:hypothetical protein